LVWIEHQPPKLGVEGSNPSPPASLFSGKKGFQDNTFKLFATS
jgi:hypothetical protein